jgi:hypothetical protein
MCCGTFLKSKICGKGLNRYLFLAYLPSGDTFSGNGRVLSGDLAVFAALDILVMLQPDTLESSPKLQQFYNTLVAHPKVNPVVKDAGLEAYYQRQ